MKEQCICGKAVECYCSDYHGDYIQPLSIDRHYPAEAMSKARFRICFDEDEGQKFHFIKPINNAARQMVINTKPISVCLVSRV